MGIIQLRALSCSKTASEIFSGSTDLFMSYMDMFSTPAPMPISMTPALILDAMIEFASNPELHNRLIASTFVVSGNPARYPHILAWKRPAPIWRTLPTTMSSTSFASTFVRLRSSCRTGLSMSSGAVSFMRPLFAFVSGVRTAAQMTTSSALFADEETSLTVI